MMMNILSLRSPADPEMYREAFNASPSSMAILDKMGKIVAVNRNWERFSIDNGGERGAYLGLNYLDMVPAGGDVVLDRIHQRLANLIRGQGNTMQLEYPCHSPGRQRWFLMHATRFKARGRDAILVVHTDITDRHIAEQLAREAAATDPLTGLFNRRSFQERAGQILAQARRDKGTVALLFIDLDDFKPLNDHLGHVAGDAMLVEVARRLKDAQREADVSARIGGDEFVVFARVCGREGVDRLLERLLPRLTASLDLEGTSITPVFSVGIALWPDDEEQLDDLMNAADQAMYQAKSEPGTRVVFATKKKTVQLSNL